MNRITFKEFLAELMVSDDPVQAMRDVKQAGRIGSDRYRKQQMASNVETQQKIQKDKDDPLSFDKLNLEKKKQDLLRAKQRLVQKEKQQQRKVVATTQQNNEV